MSGTATLSLRYPRARIAVFARAPEPGRVKTRLIPHLGAEGALALHRAMTDRTLRLVQDSGLAPMSLWVSSNPSHDYFLSHCKKKEIYLQQGADLGQRMAHCAETELSRPGTDCVLIIGTDCPPLTTGYLDAALAALESGQDCVLGPARDGGYVLIGLNLTGSGLTGSGLTEPGRPLSAVFQGMEWGSSRVLTQTLAALTALGVSALLLDELWDVDEPADLDLLAGLQPPLPWT